MSAKLRIELYNQSTLDQFNAMPADLINLARGTLDSLASGSEPSSCQELPIEVDLEGEFSKKWAVTLMGKNRLEAHTMYVYRVQNEETLVVVSCLPLFSKHGE